jgi:hypothetical protein
MILTGHAVKAPSERGQLLEQRVRSVGKRGVIDAIQGRRYPRDRPWVQILGVDRETSAGGLDRYRAAPAIGVRYGKAGAISRIDSGIQQGSDQRM